MVALSLLVNVAVLLPVCVGLLTNASWTTSAYGAGTPARAILLSIYHANGHPDLPLAGTGTGRIDRCDAAPNLVPAELLAMRCSAPHAAQAIPADRAQAVARGFELGLLKIGASA
jgi:hypothetical protein